jgi:Phage integrase, N-terminal SAM-like domain
MSFVSSAWPAMAELIPAPAAPCASPSGLPPKLLDQVRQAIRLRQLQPEDRDGIRLHGFGGSSSFTASATPESLASSREVTAFVSSLAGRGVSASTQNQALSAILFLSAVVLGQRLGWMNDIVRAQRPARLLVVLSRDEN